MKGKQINPVQQLEISDTTQIQKPTAQCVGYFIYRDGFDIPVKAVAQTNTDGIIKTIYKAKWLWFNEYYEHFVKLNDTVAPII